jgi:hypothetical protein
VVVDFRGQIVTYHDRDRHHRQTLADRYVGIGVFDNVVTADVFSYEEMTLSVCKASHAVAAGLPANEMGNTLDPSDMTRQREFPPPGTAGTPLFGHGR